VVLGRRLDPPADGAGEVAQRLIGSAVTDHRHDEVVAAGRALRAAGEGRLFDRRFDTLLIEVTPRHWGETMGETGGEGRDPRTADQRSSAGIHPPGRPDRDAIRSSEGGEREMVNDCRTRAPFSSFGQFADDAGAADPRSFAVEADGFNVPERSAPRAWSNRIDGEDGPLDAATKPMAPDRHASTTARQLPRPTRCAVCIREARVPRPVSRNLCAGRGGWPWTEAFSRRRTGQRRRGKPQFGVLHFPARSRVDQTQRFESLEALPSRSRNERMDAGIREALVGLS